MGKSFFIQIFSAFFLRCSKKLRFKVINHVYQFKTSNTAWEFNFFSYQNFE